jgi:hypothetical protein
MRFGAPRTDETASCVAGVLIRLLNSEGIAAIRPGLRKTMFGTDLIMSFF